MVFLFLWNKCWSAIVSHSVLIRFGIMSFVDHFFSFLLSHKFFLFVLWDTIPQFSGILFMISLISFFEIGEEMFKVFWDLFLVQVLNNDIQEVYRIGTPWIELLCLELKTNLNSTPIFFFILTLKTNSGCCRLNMSDWRVWKCILANLLNSY